MHKEKDQLIADLKKEARSESEIKEMIGELSSQAVGSQRAQELEEIVKEFE